MNRVLREGFFKFLESLPEGATNGSVNWADEECTYGISANLTHGQWQLWASNNAIPSVAVASSPVAIEIFGFNEKTQ